MQFIRISWGVGKLGPIGVEQRVCRTWSIDVPAGLVVVSAVFEGLIYISINSLDFG